MTTARPKEEDGNPFRAALRHSRVASEHADIAADLDPTFEHNRSTMHVHYARAMFEMQQAQTAILLSIAASLRTLAEGAGK